MLRDSFEQLIVCCDCSRLVRIGTQCWVAGKTVWRYRGIDVTIHLTRQTGIYCAVSLDRCDLTHTFGSVIGSDRT